MQPCERKAQADRILYEFGLLSRLEEIGPASIIGSRRMDMMAWNDLDIDVVNDAMSRDKLYALTAFVLERFRPVWYEAKEVVNPDGKRVWFHGFETTVTGELWNVDLWFFDRETVAAAEAYCDGIVRRADAQQKQAMVRIKQELIQRELYSFESYKSIDVYAAVLEGGVRTAEDFLRYMDQHT